jgi:hypothetical protein
VSRALRFPHGSDEVVVGMLCATVGVSVKVCLLVSPTSRVRSIETARSSCVCTLSTVECFVAMDEDVERRPGLSCFHGSTAAVGELQSNAAGMFVDTGGRLCLTGATGARCVGTEVFVRK